MSHYTKRRNCYKIEYLDREWSKWRDISKKPYITAFHSILFTEDVTPKQIEIFMMELGEIYVD